MSVLYIFVDGIGFGSNDEAANPFARYSRSFFAPLGQKVAVDIPEGLVLFPVDAALGIAGLPQSATGQTALWTGLNGPRIMGRHMTGFPGPTLIKVIQEHSIIKRFHENGKKAALANAFSEMYIQRIKERPRLTGASTHVHLASGQPLKTLDDLAQGNAVYMDITHEMMHRFFPDIKDRFPVRDPFEVGCDTARLAANYDLLIYEFFLSDKAGHNQSFEEAQWVIENLEKFLDGVCKTLRPGDTMLLTSDHGNLEDLSTKTHTNNAVPAMGFGRGVERMTDAISSIADFPAFIYELSGLEVKLPASSSSHPPQ
ncbi:MAG: metalloenzyme [Leptospirales bacterium]|nr:metalloenzyme [Leptospirales bacterium]